LAHNLHRLSNKIYNTPHLITPSFFENITEYLDKRNFSSFDFDEQLSLSDQRTKPLERLSYNADTKVGLVPVDGALSYVAHVGMCSGESASYKGILADVTTLVSAGAKVIIIDADSGGGEAYGMMETASAIRKMADDNGVRLITYVDGIAASAMYGLAATSHEIIINPEAEAGSIGVVVGLVNYSEAEKRYGAKKTFITAGDSKVPWAEDGEFKREFLDDIQMKVDRLYDKFTNHVSTFRKIPQATVKSYGAKVYVAEDALAKGLVDSIMTREEFFDYLGSIVEGDNPEMLNLLSQNKKDTEMSKEDMALLSTLQLQVEEFQLTNQSLVSKTASLEAELNTALEALKEVAKEKAEAKTANRKATLAAIVGDVQAEAKAAKMADLSDEAFAGMVEMLQSMSAEADKSVLNTELGDEGQEVVADPVDAVTAYREKTKARYEQKYNKKGAK
jgi:ClpP class serine protease